MLGHGKMCRGNPRIAFQALELVRGIIHGRDSHKFVETRLDKSIGNLKVTRDESMITSIALKNGFKTFRVHDQSRSKGTILFSLFLTDYLPLH
jgi:hypothetical protein